MHQLDSSSEGLNHDHLVKEFLDFIALMRRYRPIHSEMHENNGSEHPNLTRSQLETLFCLFRNDNQELKTLAEKQGVSSSAMTQLIDHLVNIQYLERRVDPVDRRAIRVNLTEEGLQVVKHIHEKYQQNMSKLLDCLDEQDLIDLKRIYKKLSQNFPSNL
jgi:DNA-binding MarR family transcriptional regulator